MVIDDHQGTVLYITNNPKEAQSVSGENREIYNIINLGMRRIVPLVVSGSFYQPCLSQDEVTDV